MNYYEELGVERSASSVEIRQAYRNLAKLMHPDQCPEGALRILAETQMKRLNQILTVLEDPHQRMAYDAALERDGAVGFVEPQAPVRPSLNRGSMGWWAAGLAGFAVVLFYLTGRPVSTATQPPAAPTTKTVPRAARASAQPRPRAAPSTQVPPPASRPSTPAATPQLVASTSETPAEPAPAAPPETAIGGHIVTSLPSTPAASTSTAPAPAARPQPAAAPTRLLTGTWLYAPDTSPRNAKGVYLPEFIELRVVEEGGLLRGRYRSRYSVSDQAISPLVNFQFEGPAGADRLQWEGPNGAQGEVSLQLVSDSLLEVKWKARRLSQELTLTSGAATLIRYSSP